MEGEKGKTAKQRYAAKTGKANVKKYAHAGIA